MSGILGYTVTHTWCRACAPEGVTLGGCDVRDDCGVPYLCDDCGKELLPCSHQWGEWHPWYEGGQFRMCEQEGCEEIERRADVVAGARVQDAAPQRPEKAVSEGRAGSVGEDR